MHGRIFVSCPCYRTILQGFMLKRTALIILLVALFSGTIMAIERRKEKDTDEISYFLYPLAYSVPGVGSGEGAGGTITNLIGGGSTLSLLRIRGEMEVDSIVATDMPIFTQHFTFSFFYADGRKGGFAFYDRGAESTEEPEFTLKFEATIARAYEFRLKLFEEQLEFYSGYAIAFPLIDIDESDFGTSISNLDELPPEEQEEVIATFVKNFLMYIGLVNIVIRRDGLYLDYTDDRIDPREGVRLQYEHWGFEGEGLTNFWVEDYSLTAYFPNDDLSSVLVANLFYSQSAVIKPLEYNEGTFYQECLDDSKKGGSKTDGVSDETACRGVQRGIEDFLETEADNSNATSLGGPTRLRSYPVGRFHDRYSFFAGLEYRMYLMEHTTPFDFILEKGVFEAAQIAFFYEIGQVAPDNDASLFNDFKHSSGMGLRLIFSSVVLRADYATGGEGEETTIFIGYGF
jgi:hypothetical protein